MGANGNWFVGLVDTGIRAIGPTGPTGPSLSSYVEAVGNNQIVEENENIVFGGMIDEIDVVGTDIAVDPTGTIFWLMQPGLYSAEWSVNLIAGTQPVIICITEDGDPISAMATTLSEGNVSSGGLINVTAADVPYAISLRNCGGPIELGSPSAVVNGGVASIRILKFADGPSV